MTAYPKQDLRNKEICSQASDAFRTKCIGATSYRKILEAHPVDLYTPNYFIRFGLSAISIICILFSSLLLGLISGMEGENGFAAMSLFFGIACYACLELLVAHKKYYDAGIDNVLSFAAVGFLIAGFALLTDGEHLELLCFISLLACTWMSFRFADAFMAVMAYCSLMGTVYYGLSGDVAGALLTPFIIMAVSLVMYLIVERFLKNRPFGIYRNAGLALKTATLVSFYAAGNYFVVSELSNDLRYTEDGKNAGPGLLFWILTVATPVFYIGRGIFKKDIVFIRTGVLLIAASILTIRYYHAIMPPESALVIAGAAMLSIGYLLVRYLRTPKNGFSAEDTGHASKGLLNLEALIIAETLGKHNHLPKHEGVEFGGGASGGGGATGKF